ncbi:hypothetical protein I551_5283 [Mycobacterium ulcerans str. Harvey]|uniref:Uncharacterized protein n=1 Tax=Mycobacterium ulcerans str. Harvey TaxID=1299332 RepID=A0ABN0QU66_MYCUL|nr:hypothetical protein I551_5283 [Mycobacterium ulcerans str. Harvey]
MDGTVHSEFPVARDIADIEPSVRDRVRSLSPDRAETIRPSGVFQGARPAFVDRAA